MTENELKYVLNHDCESLINGIADMKTYISQAYLVSSRGVSLRVRKSLICGNGLAVLPAEYHMTFKYSTKGRVIEIEKKIDKRDFNDLWEVSMNKLDKTRYKINKPEIWEIDFFKDHNDKTYFVMAEHEMPEGQLCPNIIPTYIKSNLIYEVALGDCRFSSKMLADCRFANKLFKEIVNNITEG